MGFPERSISDDLDKFPIRQSFIICLNCFYFNEKESYCSLHKSEIMNCSYFKHVNNSYSKCPNHINKHISKRTNITE